MISKRLKKLFVLLMSIWILVISTTSSYANTGAYEYNDFNLYSTGGTLYTSSVFYSNNSSLSSFAIIVNVNNNEWGITDGGMSSIPFPSGVEIDYTDRTTFLQSAYVVVNGNTYNFTFIDNSGVFYCQNIPASPYYPVVNIYLPTTGSSTPSIPSTPTLSWEVDSNNHTVLTFTPNYTTSGCWAKVAYKTSQAGPIDSYISTTANSPFQVFDVGYYNVCLQYYVDGQLRQTDWSNTVYVDDIPVIDPIEPEHDIWWILQQFEKALNTITSFLQKLKTLFATLFDWLPEDVMYVFWAVLILSIVLRIFIK